MKAITIIELTKYYKSGNFSSNQIIALENVSFSVDTGEIFGLLGPNGAGKTTLVKILLGITFPTKGKALIFDKNNNDVKIKFDVGYLPENHKFPPYLTGYQVLDYFGRLSGISGKDLKNIINKNLEIVELEKWQNTKIKKYSKGMLQRLGLAQALINNPKLIFLDEPTDGVDPIGRKKIRDILLNLKGEGKTIFLNSHLLSEIELICDRIAILNKGNLIKEGNVKDITTSSDNYLFYTSDLSNEIINKLLNDFKAVIINKNSLSFKDNNIVNVNKVIDYLRNNNVIIFNFGKEKSTLENMFINLIEQSYLNN